MRPKVVVLFIFFTIIGVLGAFQWRDIMSGERDLGDRIPWWSWGESSRRAYVRCFPIMVIMMWFMALTMGLITAVDVGLLPMSSRVAARIGFSPVLVLMVLAASVAAFNKPSFLVPRTKRDEPGMLQRSRASSTDPLTPQPICAGLHSRRISSNL